MNTNVLSVLRANAREQVENYLDQLPPLMMWGDFIFQLSTLAYSKLSLSDVWTWAAQGRIGKPDLLQYTGKKRPTLKFDCELYATLINPSLLTMALTKYGLINDVSDDPVEQLRLQASMKTPLMLVAGTGKVMGFWVMTELSQVMDEFRPNSQAKHQTITLSLQYYGERLADGQTVPDTLSLGFRDKDTRLSEALETMKKVIGGVFDG
ncbi:phage tail protein [Serratia quinivorans]|uniref:Phage protein U n=1 Tax=Serratia quinivorans TaxID=137545 RepID=A0A379YFH8_9GAMM|nr:phage tail protein [Serratia quinivorans]CAI1717226.1 Phage protein U [Serratia quinivorans]SUI43905.1 Phage protein U [Serratia quinivorans]